MDYHRNPGEWWARRSTVEQSLTLALAIYLLFGVIDGLFSYHGMMTYGASWDLNPYVRALFRESPEKFLWVKLIGTIKQAAIIFICLAMTDYLGFRPLRWVVWGVTYLLIAVGLAVTVGHLTWYLTP